MNQCLMFDVCLKQLQRIAEQNDRDLIMNREQIKIGHVVYIAGNRTIEEDLFEAVLFFVRHADLIQKE